MYTFLRGLYNLHNCIISILYKLFLKLSGVKIGSQLYVRGFPQICSRRNGGISIGNKCKLYSTMASNPVGINHKCIIRALLPDATIQIGDKFGMSGGTILARKNITVDDGVLFGGNCFVTDSDHHPIDPDLRKKKSSKGVISESVWIKNNVWLGLNVMVLKGVVIGENTVVGAGSVVVHSLPDNVVAAGNPAKVIRKLTRK